MAFDNCQQQGGNTTSLTIADFVTTGSDICLLVFVGIDAASDFSPACSYGGVSMGALVQEAATGRWQGVFIATGLAAQTGDIFVSSLPGGGREQVFAISFNDIASYDALPAAISSASLVDASINVTSDATDTVVSGLSVNTSSAPTAAGGETVPTNGSLANAAMSGAVSYATGVSAMSWTHVATSVTLQAVVLNATGGGGGNRRRRVLMAA